MNTPLKFALGMVFWPFLLLFYLAYFMFVLALYFTPLGWFVLYINSHYNYD